MKTSVPICTLTSDAQIVDIASELITFEISGIDLESEVFVKLHNILTIEKILLQSTPAPTIDQIGHLKHLRGISSTDLLYKTVDLVIGCALLIPPIGYQIWSCWLAGCYENTLSWILFGPSLVRSNAKQDRDSSACINVVVFENVESFLDLNLFLVDMLFLVVFLTVIQGKTGKVWDS